MTRSRSVAVVALAVMMWASVTAWAATPILLNNASFEDPALAEGAITVHQTAPGVPDWTIAATNSSAGIINLDETGQGEHPDYMGAAGGLNVLWLNNGSATQITGTAVAANTTYTLSVEIAHRHITSGPLAGELPNSYTIEILAGDTPIGSSSFPATSGTMWQTSTAMVDVLDGDPHIGQPLGVRLSVGGIQPLFDAVSLSYEPVPEPASLMLLGAGGLLLLRPRRS